VAGGCYTFALRVSKSLVWSTKIAFWCFFWLKCCITPLPVPDINKSLLNFFNLGDTSHIFALLQDSRNLVIIWYSFGLLGTIAKEKLSSEFHAAAIELCLYATMPYILHCLAKRQNCHLFDSNYDIYWDSKHYVDFRDSSTKNNFRCLTQRPISTSWHAKLTC